MPLGLFKRERTFRLTDVEGGTQFSMTEEFGGPLSALITRAIPGMTESFDQYAGALETAAERSDPCG